MVKLKARLESSDVVISQDSFEHLLSCLDNQKFIHDVNADGLSEGHDVVQSVQQENQKCIDDFNHQCRSLLHGEKMTG